MDEIRYELQQLAGMGYIRYEGNKFYLTEAGEAAAKAIEDRLPMQDRLLLLMAWGELVIDTDE